MTRLIHRSFRRTSEPKLNLRVDPGFRRGERNGEAQENSGGNTMSLKKSVSRRLSLLTGSSLVAASLTALGGLTLAPAAAFAQATCVSTPLPAGNGTNNAVYAAGTYNPGIACVYTGTTAVVSTAGDITVSSTAGGTGIDLSATGTSSVIWDSAAGRVIGGAQVNGPVIDATSQAGDINIAHAAITANGATTTHAIRATSTGGGDITIARTGSTFGAIATTGAMGQTAMEAVTNGGDIAISSVGNIGAYNGTTYGIRAQTSGAGAVSLNLGNTVQASQPTSIAAILATAGTGGVNIAITTGAAQTFTTGAYAIIVATPGALQVTNDSGYVIGAVNFSGVTGPGVTFDMRGNGGVGRWLMRGASVFSAGADTLTLGGVVNNELDAGASVALGAGADTFSIAGLLANAGTIDFGTGNDTLTATRLFGTKGTTLNFGDGADTFNLSGLLSVSGLTISGLETFNHSGLIIMGLGSLTSAGGFQEIITQSDEVGDDVLKLNGAAWTGSGDARILLDAVLGKGVQAGCETPTGAADCLDLRGGSTAGVTTLTVHYGGGDNDLGAYTPVGATVVDVSGGTSAAEHFVLDPNSSGYVVDPVLGPSLERPGLFRYILDYDAQTQRHVIIGLPRGELLEYAILSGAAHSIWHMTTETVTDRQTDLRDGAEGGSLWVKAAGESTQRDVMTTFEGVSRNYAVDNSYNLYAGVILGGMDFATGSSGGFDYVLGGQIGYVSSSLDLDESDSSGRFSGGTGGVYGSLWSTSLFLDGTVNFNGLTLDYESLALGGIKTTTFLNSIGAAAEGGWRATLTENTFAEPLAAVSWVRTTFEEVSLSGGEIAPSAAESLRAGLGMRLGATLAGETVSASYFVTGRSWYEFEGESRGFVHNSGADLPFADEFTGAFGEAELGVNVSNASNTLSGFLTSGVKWKDGYSAVNLSLGVRMAW